MSQNNTSNSVALSEREMMLDSLNTQEMMTASYNSFICECSTKDLRNAFLTILDDEHDIFAEVSEEMSSRGWQQNKQAEQSEILKVKQKISKES